MTRLLIRFIVKFQIHAPTKDGARPTDICPLRTWASKLHWNAFCRIPNLRGTDHSHPAVPIQARWGQNSRKFDDVLEFKVALFFVNGAFFVCLDFATETHVDGFAETGSRDFGHGRKNN